MSFNADPHISKTPGFPKDGITFYDISPILEDRTDVIEGYPVLWEAGGLGNMRVRVKAHAVPFSPNDGHEGLARYSLTVAPLP